MRFRKSLVYVLAFLLVFANFGIVASAKGSEKDTQLPSKVQSPTKHFSKTIKRQDLVKYNPDDNVRVIVQMVGKPAIVEATEKGRRFSELPKTTRDSLIKKALNEQQTVKNYMKNKGISMKFMRNFTTVVNGFSGIVKYKEIPFIEKLKGVKAVHIATEYQRPIEKPEDVSSNDLVNAPSVWNDKDYGYKGEGMTVAIIDTGIDYRHKDMKISDPSKEELTQDGVAKLIQDNSLPGKFFTDKVPYGYNYADNNDTIIDLGKGASMHGMHVAGIVAANGELKGIAPEAQLLAMKVFSNDVSNPSTWSDIYVKAIDDSVILGADAINMSLGSTASFVEPDAPDQVAIQNASENGVLLSISAGNSAYFGNGYDLPYASNPDTGVVGSPSVATNAISVASFENDELQLPFFTYSVDDTVQDKVPYMAAEGTPDPVSAIGAKGTQVLDAGIGDVGDFEGKDFTGKIALIRRGTLDFVTKTLNAQKAGAVGVIIYNNVEGYVSMATDPAIHIPQLFAAKEYGEAIKAQLDAGRDVKIDFTGDKMQTPSPTAGQMSDFSSWGVTPNLDFKPEITAPGGNILSTLNDNTYGMMSGTSMAAPAVSGGIALIMERVDKDFGLKNIDRTLMTKNILMNTANPQIDKGPNQFIDIPYSPRRQGSGLMDLYAAMKTPVVITEVNSGQAKATLKEIGDKVTFTLKATNYSDQDTVYNVEGDVQTDLSYSGYDFMEADAIVDNNTGNFPISFKSDNGYEDGGNYQVTVPANGSATIDVTIDLSNAVDYDFGKTLENLFDNGNFVEGFVRFVDPSDNNPQLSVPYVGFYGDWNKAPILDEFVDNIYNSFYGAAGMVTDEGTNSYPYLGIDPVKVDENELPVPGIYAISPNGDNVQDNILPVLTFLRNAKNVEFNVLDQDKNKLRTIRTRNNVYKDYYDGGLGTYYQFFTDAKWDGMVNNQLVSDGLYYYDIKTRIDYPNAEWQEKLVPVYVDTVKPDVEASYDESTGKVQWNANDTNGSGVASFEVIVNNKSASGLLASDVNEFTLSDTSDVKSVKVIVTDWAGNSTTATPYNENDNTIPYIQVDEPETLGIYNSFTVPVSGTVEDDSDIKSLTVNGNPVELTWDKENGDYTFNTTVTYDSDGKKAVKFAAADNQGNNIDFEKQILIDTTPGTLKVEAPETTDKESAELKINVGDNFAETKVTVNGDEAYYHEQVEPYEISNFTHEFTYPVNLHDGTNTFKVVLTDLANNKTTVTRTIIKSSDNSSGGGTNNGGSGSPGPTVPSTVTPETGNLYGVSTTTLDNGQGYQASLPSADIQSLLEKDENATFNFHFEGGTYELPAKWVSDLPEGSTVHFVARQVETNNIKTMGAKLIGTPIDFQVEVIDSNGKKTTIDNFDGYNTRTLIVDNNSENLSVMMVDSTTGNLVPVPSVVKTIDGKRVAIFKRNGNSTYCVVQYQKSFKDITHHWAKNDIEALAGKMIIKGKTIDTYAPNAPITRAEFATLLVRTLGIQNVATDSNSFTDVHSSDWFANAVSAAVKSGIIKGYTDGTFRPNKNISREELAAMMDNALKYAGKTIPNDSSVDLSRWKDYGKVSNWASQSIRDLVGIGILKGDTNSLLQPKASTTRAESAALLNRMLEYLFSE